MTQLSDYIGALIGGVDLSSSPTNATVTIVNSGGNNATILGATDALAGVMTATQVDKLNNIAAFANNYVHPAYTQRQQNISVGNLTGGTVISQLSVQLLSNSLGHVSSASASALTRVLTLADLNYTGDDNANYYVHPSYTSRNTFGDTGTLSGAFVVSRVKNLVYSDTQGHLTNSETILETRALTPADIGAADAADQLQGSAQVVTPAFTGGTTNGTTSGTLTIVTIGAMVIVSGRITWTTAPTGSGQMRITGLPFTSDYNCGFSFPSKRLENNSNDANGHGGSLGAGSNQIYLWDNRASGENIACAGNNFNSSGWIDVNFSYISSQVTYP